MSVKRYTHHRSSYKPSFMDEQGDGDYVIHSDYADLLARHNALVEAAKPVAAWWRKERMFAEPPYQIEHLVLGTDGPECVGVYELDALATLVGEEGE